MARRTLSQEVKDGILAGLKEGVSKTELAGKFGVSVPTVYNYAKRQVVSAPSVTTLPHVIDETPVTTPEAVVRKGTKHSR
jgi:hypothetical protein